jgi:hypothetical protein
MIMTILITRDQETIPAAMSRPKGSELLSDTQFSDDSFVPLYVLGSQIIQEPSALTHKL